jgi:hypothetical protein
MQPLAHARVYAFLEGLIRETSVAGVISMPLMLLAVIWTKADAQALAMLVIVARGSPPLHRPFTALPTASAHATEAWFFRCMVLFENEVTRPAPLTETALLFAQTDTCAS